MKKLWLGFLFFAAPCFATGNPQLVYQMAVSSFTVNVIAVSSSVATQVDLPALNGRAALEIQNQSQAANLWCGPGTQNAVVNKGREILAGGNTWFIGMANSVPASGLNPASVPLVMYCINDSTFTAANAAISQAY